MGIRDVPWRRATYLHERTWPASPFDEAGGAARYATWKRLGALKNPSLSVAEALEPLGCSEEELTARLSDTFVEIDERAEPPSWFQNALHFWNLGGAGSGVVDESEDVTHPFSRVFTGAAAHFDALLEEDVSVLSSTVSSAAELYTLLKGSLADQAAGAGLREIVLPTVALLLHRRRTSGARHEGEASYGVQELAADLLVDGEIEKVFAEFPVLLRLLTEHAVRWHENRNTFILRFLEDEQLIAERFWGGRRAQHVSVSFGAGDSHNGGASVAVVRTDAGTVLYKPRGGENDLAYAHIVDRLNAEDIGVSLRHPRVLSRAGFSWHEFVGSEPVHVADGDELARQLGAHLGILTLFRGRDMHFENVRLSGDGVWVLDTECLFDTQSISLRAEPSGDPLIDDLQTELQESCLAVNILPMPIRVPHGQGYRRVDLTFLGVTSQEQSPMRVNLPQFSADGGVAYSMEVPKATNLETETDAERLSILNRPDEFSAGFEAVISKLRELDDEGVDDLLGPLSDVQCRVVMRPTMHYYKVLLESYHPDFLRDGLDRELCLGKLLNGHPAHPERVSIVGSEISQLRSGDIPAFFLAAGSGAFYAAGSEDRPISYLTSPLEDIAASIRAFDERRAAVNADIIRFSFSLPEEPRSPLLEGFERPALPIGSWKEASDALTASTLARGIPVSNGALNWFTLVPDEDTGWSIAPTNWGVYGGAAGIYASLFSHFGSAKGPTRDIVLDPAHAAAASAVPVIAKIISDAPADLGHNEISGGYGVLAGLLSTLLAAQADGRPDRGSRETEICLDLIERIGAQDLTSDVISGNAGLILLLQSCKGLLPEPRRLRVLSVLAERLAHNASTSAFGVAYSPSVHSSPVLGYSHGTSGIAAAFAAAHAELGDPKYREQVWRHLDYERPIVESHGNTWPDLRVSDTQLDLVDYGSWCHGSPGAAIARLHILRSLSLSGAEEARIRRELGWAVAQTVAVLVDQDAPHNQSLCHGDLGALGCIIEVKRFEPSLVSAEQLNLAQGAVANRLDEAQWRSGSLLGQFVPDLMMGAAGMIWGLDHVSHPLQGFNPLTTQWKH